MNRRSLLKGLLALPFAPLAAKLAPVGIPVNHSDHLVVTEAHVPPMTASEVTRRYEEKMLDLKPVIESLNQRNLFLRDIVWKGDIKEI